MIFHENRLPADDSHEISCLIAMLEKAAKFEKIIDGALWVKNSFSQGLAIYCSRLYMYKNLFKLQAWYRYL